MKAFTPTTWPSTSTRGPPLLPGLMGASVWMTSIGVPSSACRAGALITPIVTVLARPCGLPTANTSWPACTGWSTASGSGGRPCASILSSARSVSGCTPTTRASYTRCRAGPVVRAPMSPSGEGRRTRIRWAPRTTWWFVITKPSRSTMSPDASASGRVTTEKSAATSGSAGPKPVTRICTTLGETRATTRCSAPSSWCSTSTFSAPAASAGDGRDAPTTRTSARAAERLARERSDGIVKSLTTSAVPATQSRVAVAFVAGRCGPDPMRRGGPRGFVEVTSPRACRDGICAAGRARGAPDRPERPPDAELLDRSGRGDHGRARRRRGARGVLREPALHLADRVVVLVLREDELVDHDAVEDRLAVRVAVHREQDLLHLLLERGVDLRVHDDGRDPVGRRFRDDLGPLGGRRRLGREVVVDEAVHRGAVHRALRDLLDRLVV